ncbi:high affinity copper uptake protein 1 isoform X1 [Lucilia cuprina]|uniref:high affinity copper uptake protein 1 isoform X1 n=1 Tax=Lucilia cuprina TaxID=7375 RepID=UPI001F05E772|nr:high affinity copper uptake protein 1 isoform X1 [Lucilia cuprina]XP_046802139.1 high affinity copper uptake protein 1 isoform X1 [Lucilia cuprina]
MMDHSQHTLENHADHSMHHSMHDHATMDHSAIMSSTTTTTEMPANVHIHHDVNSVHHHHAAAASGGESMLHHAMSMAFHFGYNETILFEWWKIDSVGGLLGSMLAIFIMAVLYEGLKYYREFLFWKTYNLLEYRPVTGPQANPEAGQRPAPQPSASPVQYVGEVIHKQPPTMFSLHHFFQTFLHIVQVTVSFLLMLIFMTYNIWLCIAVVLGAGVGYFLFCWKKSVIVDVTEHCH